MSAPNVLLLVVDSLRADAIFGGHIPTPTITGLAGTGASFTQCVCTATTTTPSFSSLLTGCFPPRHGVRGLTGYRLSPNVPTMAEAFSAAGYKTVAEVTGPLLPETGVLRGFDESKHRQAYKVPFFGWRDDVVATLRGLTRPWLMLLHIWEVHRPYRSPPDFEKRKDRAGYEAAVAATDDYLKPVFDAAGDNTVVVVTGDHGEDYPDSVVQFQLVRTARRTRRALRLSKWLTALDKRLAGLEIGHGFALYERLVRVPLVISGPGVSPAVVGDQVRHVDLLPTLAELCGLDRPADVNGRSVTPLIEGESLPEEPAYLEAVGVKLEGDRIVGARTPDWKLLRPGRGRPTLFKLDGGAPPDEKHNLYRRYPEVARQLEDWIERIEAESVSESGMTSEEESAVEQHLKDLGYL